MNARAYTGTTHLLRLALRQDRIKLPIWVASLTGVAAVSAASVVDLYPTAEDRLGYATTAAMSVVARAFNGPTSGPSLGAILFTETFTFTAVMVALMSAQTVVRHTRREEESGRSELIGASVVGRLAPLATGVIMAGGASLLIGLLLTLVFLSHGLALPGSVGAGAAMALVGLVFAAVASVTSQVMESARGANSSAGAVIGLAFLLRAAGDALGEPSASGIEVTSAWPSWLSPIGWGNQLRPFSQDNWGVLVLMASLAAALAAAGWWLNGHRDLGTGMLRTRPGPASAPAGLRSALGLAWRLQRGVLLGWGVGILILAAAYGTVTNEINKMVGDNERMREIIAQLGGSENLVNAYVKMTMLLFGLVISGYAVQALLRLRQEETGPLEAVLATSVSRSRWLAAHLICVASGAALLLALAGAAMGLPYGVVVDDVTHQTLTTAGYGLVQFPAVLVLIGLVVAAFGLAPRRTAPVAWGFLAWCAVVVQLGDLLKLPGWARDLAPHSHVPLTPGHSVQALPLVLLTLLGAALVATSFLGFRRRDISPQ